MGGGGWGKVGNGRDGWVKYLELELKGGGRGKRVNRYKCLLKIPCFLISRTLTPKKS